MGYRVIRRGKHVAVAFKDFHRALAYGRVVGNNRVEDSDGIILAVHGIADEDDEELFRREPSALRRAQYRNDQRTGRTIRVPVKRFAHEIIGDDCDHSWQRMAHDDASFRCDDCGALGYRTQKPTRFISNQPILTRRCSTKGCMHAARHAGYRGYVKGVCDLHRTEESAA